MRAREALLTAFEAFEEARTLLAQLPVLPEERRAVEAAFPLGTWPGTRLLPVLPPSLREDLGNREASAALEVASDEGLEERGARLFGSHTADLIPDYTQPASLYLVLRFPDGEVWGRPLRRESPGGEEVLELVAREKTALEAVRWLEEKTGALRGLALEVARRLREWLEEDREALEELRVLSATNGLRGA